MLRRGDASVLPPPSAQNPQPLAGITIDIYRHCYTTAAYNTPPPYWTPSAQNHNHLLIQPPKPPQKNQCVPTPYNMSPDHGKTTEDPVRPYRWLSLSFPRCWALKAVHLRMHSVTFRNSSQARRQQRTAEGVSSCSRNTEPLNLLTSNLPPPSCSGLVLFSDFIPRSQKTTEEGRKTPPEATTTYPTGC